MRAFLWVLVVSGALPQISNQAGWFTAEMGRQPWIVYGLLKTNEAVSPVLKSSQVLGSMILFFLIYALLTVLFLYLFLRMIQEGPAPGKTPQILPEGWQPLALKAGRQTRGGEI